jgi:hypothetical protein
MTIPIEEASGRAMASAPQMIIRIPHTIDHPLAFLPEPRDVSEFIFLRARLTNEWQ